MHMRPELVQRYARITAVLLLLTIVCGFFGEVWVPGRLVVAGDAAATARNVATHDLLHRLGFAAYLVEALCDVALAMLFYFLLRPVRRDLALLAAFFGLVSTALYGVAEIFYFAPSLLLGGAAYLKAFTPEQLDAMTMLSLRLFGRVSGIFMAMYGLASILRGWLIYRSGFLPRLLGVLLMIAGSGFVVKNFTLLLAPAYSSDFLLLPMFLAVVSLTGWLFVRGVDVARWGDRARS